MGTVLQAGQRSAGKPFVVIIDEWDCIFREYKQDREAQEKYLDFLRDLMWEKKHCAYIQR